MVGLDAAGKTTILYKLKLGEIVTTIPTVTSPNHTTHLTVFPGCFLKQLRLQLWARAPQLSGADVAHPCASLWHAANTYPLRNRLDSTSKLLSTRTSTSPCGMLVRTRGKIYMLHHVHTHAFLCIQSYRACELTHPFYDLMSQKRMYARHDQELAPGDSYFICKFNSRNLPICVHSKREALFIVAHACIMDVSCRKRAEKKKW
jgi:hypothetical protein